MTEHGKMVRDILADLRFTRSEKQALKQVIEDASRPEASAAAVRNEAFDALKEILPASFHALVDSVEGVVKATIQSDICDSDRTECFFSPGDECLNKIKSLLRSARSSLDICVFTITDNRVTREIVAAHKRGIKVRVVTDNDKRYDAGSDIFGMRDAGIEIKVDTASDHMHHKFMLVDGEILLCGSYNWTRSAASSNNEDILVTDSKTATKAFEGEFERLWDTFRSL